MAGSQSPSFPRATSMIRRFEPTCRFRGSRTNSKASAGNCATVSEERANRRRNVHPKAPPHPKPMACQGTRTFEKARMQGDTGSVIRLGTVVANRGHQSAETMRALAAEGFESFEIAFKNTLAGTDLRRLADEATAALDGTRAV